MKNNMNEIDEMIKETLSREEAEFYDSLEEQNLVGMLSGLLDTRLRWLIVMVNIVQVAAFGMAVYCIIQFFGENTTDELIKWGAGGFVFLMMTTVLKMFTWMQMDKNVLLREIKRLELQLASLSQKIG